MELYYWALLLLGSCIDIKKRALPIYFLIGGLISSMFFFIIKRPVGLEQMLGGIGLGIGLCLLSKVCQGAIGYGDGILIGILGITMGFMSVFTLFIMALVIASIIALFLMVVLKKNKKMAFPFVPCLCIAYGILGGL